MAPLRAGLWTLPSVVAYLLASVAGPALARRIPPHRVIIGGLIAMTAGFAVLASVGAGGLAAAVAGNVVVRTGLAPVYTLTTDLVVSGVRPQRAGMAAAVTETGAELGGALGIAVLGSLSVAVYRHGMSGPGPASFGLPSNATLVDAVVAAGALPVRAGAELLGYAQAAYLSALAVMALTAAALVA